MATLQAAIDKANGYAYGGRGAISSESVYPPEELIGIVEQRYGGNNDDDDDNNNDGDGDGAGAGAGAGSSSRGRHSGASGADNSSNVAELRASARAAGLGDHILAEEDEQAMDDDDVTAEYYID